MSKIRVAIVGVGNCASSLVQGVTHYADADQQRLLRTRLARHAAALPLGWFAWQSDTRRYWLADFRSGVGERRQWQLSDISQPG